MPPGVSGPAAGGEMTADQRAAALSRIRAHRNTIGEPFDPALESLFAEAPAAAAAAAAAEVTPGTRRSKRDRRPTKRAVAGASPTPAPTNFEEAFGAVAAEEIAMRAGTDRDVTHLNVAEEEEEDEGITAILNDPSIGQRGRNLRRGDPKPAAGLFVMGGHSTGAPAASTLMGEETAAARRRRFGGSGLLPPQVNANRVAVGVENRAPVDIDGPTVPSILEAGEPVDQGEIDDEEAEAEAARFAAEEAGISLPAAGKPDLDQLKRGVVAESTLKSYMGCLQSFFKYLYDNQPSWLTPLGKLTVEKLRDAPPNEKTRARQKRVSSIMDAALTGCLENAYLVDISSITPDGFMEFVLSLEKEVQDPDDPTKKKLANLSKSAYDNHRSALNHLFRLHNGIGLESVFAKRLALHYQSHKRWLSKNLPAKDASGSGKEAIPVALYRYLCKCFFEMGTREGVFCHAYLLLTWNLGCRANNTAKVRLCDLHCSSRDCFSIAFSHTKNDQLAFCR